MALQANATSKATRYAGYTSFSYLDAGKDYTAYKLAAEIDRVPSKQVEVTAEQERLVWEILDETVVVALHEHPFVVPEDLSNFFEYRRQGRDATGYQGLSVSGIDVVFDNLMDGTASITSRSGWKWDDIVYDLGMRLSDISHQKFLVWAGSVHDILRAKANGQIAWVPALESSTPIENELDRIDILYGLGIRMMGIVYSEANALGSGHVEPSDAGLTIFGRQAVRRMNQLGMAIDISHSSNLTALDTIETSEVPVFLTHGVTQGMRPHWRTKPDEVLRACADKGGVIGIIAAPNTSVTLANPRHNLEGVMEHFEYCANLVGIDHVTLGLDTMFGDHVGVLNVFASQLSLDLDPARRPTDYEPCEFVDGVESPAEGTINCARWLVKHGYSREDIAKVLGENSMRVLREVWWT
jgi:membrane dipeptidase